MKEIKWDWYSFWVIDWLMTDDHWEMYDIWEKAYLAANPDLEEARENSCIDGEGNGTGTLLDLLENHYHQSLIPVYNSLAYKIFFILGYPVLRISALFWDCKSLIHRGKLLHQI